MKIILRIIAGIFGFILFYTGISVAIEVIQNGGNAPYIIGGLLGVALVWLASLSLITYAYQKSIKSLITKKSGVVFLLFTLLFMVAYYYYNSNKKNEGASFTSSSTRITNIPEEQNITDSVLYEQAKNLKGLADFHIDKTTVKNINELRIKLKNDSRYPQVFDPNRSHDSFLRKSKDKEYVVYRNNRYKEFLKEAYGPLVGKLDSTGYHCPEVSKYHLPKYYIGENLIHNINLTFFRDTLIRIECYRASVIDSAFIYKYGEGLRISKIDSTENYGGLYNIMRVNITRWENENVCANFISCKAIQENTIYSNRDEKKIIISSKSDKWERIKQCESETKRKLDEEDEQRRIKALELF